MSPNYTGTTANKFLRLPNDEVFNYNLWDVRWTSELFFALQRELKGNKMVQPQGNSQWDYYEANVLPLCDSVLAMRRRGIPVSKEAKRRYSLSLTVELRHCDKWLCDRATADGFTYTDKFPNSNKQAGEYLYDTLGLKPLPKTKKRAARSVSQEALLGVYKKLRKKDQRHIEVLERFLHRSRLATIKARYLGFPVERDGRIRPNLKVAGTKTFRYAATDPAIQQWPEEVRHFVEAPPGFTLVSADYSQLEARILAILAGDNVSLAVFDSGEDIHVANACDLFGYTRAQYQELAPVVRKSARGYGKYFLYRISYGGEAGGVEAKAVCPCPKCVDKVPPVASLTRKQAAEAGERWYAAHPAVRTFQAELCASVRKHHYYDSPFGLRRWVGKAWGADLEREIKNLPMQTNAALLMNQRQLRLDEAGIPLILQHHDSFLALVPDADVSYTVSTLREVMEAPAPELGGHIFPVDVVAGQNWGHYDPERNPSGLRDI